MMQGTFASREELLAYVQSYSRARGFAVVIEKSNLPRGQVWLRCDLGGSSRSSTTTTTNKRKRSSRLRNCPFQLYGKRVRDATGSWLLQIRNDQHNHPLSATEHHPIVRRLTTEQKQLVAEWTASGLRPAMIVQQLKEKFPDKPFKVQDIYNARTQLRRTTSTKESTEAAENESVRARAKCGNMEKRFRQALETIRNGFSTLEAQQQEEVVSLIESIANNMMKRQEATQAPLAIATSGEEDEMFQSSLDVVTFHSEESLDASCLRPGTEDGEEYSLMALTSHPTY